MEESLLLVSVDAFWPIFQTPRLTILRPKEFVKIDPYADSDEEESTVGKMPPSDSEDDY